MTTTQTHTSIAAAVRSPRPLSSSRLARAGLALAGLCCVALGGVGVYLPGLPTTVFLIAAAWCFARSCPWLEDRLVRNRFFAPFLVYLDRSRPMPRRAKAGAIGTMAFFVAVSVSLLLWRDVGPPWLALLVVALACVGAAVIILWDRPGRSGRPRRA